MHINNGTETLIVRPKSKKASAPRPLVFRTMAKACNTSSFSLSDLFIPEDTINDEVPELHLGIEA